MSFTNPHFEDPRWLWLALLGPVLLLALQLYAAAARKRQLARVAAQQVLPTLTASFSPTRRGLKNVLLLLTVAALGLALARPQWGEIETQSDWSAEDVVFALDCSQSMMATDVLPNRLERAKLAIRDFVRREARGRVGLVAFAGSAFLQCPLTFDHEAFEDALQAVDARTIAVAGTDLGRALREAEKAMEKTSRRKVVVLLTDGEDLEKNGVTMAQRLSTNGVVVQTIGVGTATGGEIVTRNAAGQPELLRDAKGEVVRSRLDEETLQTIAGATGGGYFPLGRLGEGLMRVAKSLAASGHASRTTPAHAMGVERFHAPLTVALILLVAESLIAARRRRSTSGVFAPVARTAESGLRTTAPATATLAMALILGAVFVASSRGEVTNVFEPVAPPPKPPDTARGLYNAGTERLVAAKLAEAETFLLAALAKQEAKVQSPAIYNLGHVRFLQGEEELKKKPDPKRTAARARAVAEHGARVGQQLQEALAGEDTDKMVAAYRAGRGIRREARAVAEQFKRAMELYAATLLKWQRSLGDFRSAAELNPADTNATRNAEIVEQHIAKLIDEIRELQQAMMPMTGAKSSFSDMMQELKGKIPAEKMPPGAPGEDDDDEITLDGLGGMQESPGREGQEMELPLSPDEAADLLDGMRLGGERRLPMGRGENGDQEGKPQQKTRQPW